MLLERFTCAAILMTDLLVYEYRDGLRGCYL